MDWKIQKVEDKMTKKNCALMLIIIGAILLSGCVGQEKTNKSSSNIKLNTEDDPLYIKAMAIRGEYQDADTKKYQYEIDFSIKNNGNSEVVFDTIGLYCNVNDRTLPLVYTNDEPEKKWTIGRGEIEIIPTNSGNMIDGGVALAKSISADSINLTVVLFNNGQYLNGEYFTALPLIDDLPHESEGVARLLRFAVIYPQTQEDKDTLAQMYEALPLPNNKFGKDVVQINRQRSPEQQKPPSNNLESLNIVGAATYDVSPMSNSLEYSIDVTVTNTGSSAIMYDQVRAYFDDQKGGKVTEFNAGTTTLKPGQSATYNFLSVNAWEMISNVEAAGKKTIVMYVYLYKDGKEVSAAYSASLPPLDYLQNLGGQKHHLEYSKN